MIIDDEDPSSPTKIDQPQPLPTTRREVPEDVPPPAYSGPSAPHPAPVHDAHTGPSTPLLDTEAQVPKEEPAGRRFFKAFGIAFAIWLTIAILSGSTIRSTYPTIRAGVPLPKKRPSNLQQQDGKVLECHTGQRHWSPTTGAAHSMSLEMALPSEAFYLFARGAYTEGRLLVVHDADWTHRSTIMIDIQAVTAHNDLLNDISICRMERKKNERGIGLLVPNAKSPGAKEPSVTWHLTVHLPASFDYAPLIVPAFETVLPRFAITMEDMHDDVVFGFLGLAATDGEISMGWTYSETAQLLTSNGGIHGTIAATELEVVASKRPVNMNITVFKDGNNDGKLLLKTSNAPAYANIGLMDSIPSRESGDGAFHVVTRTGNAPLDVTVVDLPLDAEAHFAASGSSATLRLPHTFEGGFQLNTMNAQPEVQFDGGVRDPGYRGRERRMVERQVANKKFVGAVGWVEQKHERKSRSEWGSWVEERRRPGIPRAAGLGGSHHWQERHRRFREQFEALEAERGDVGVQSTPEVEPLDWRDWTPPIYGNYSGSALVVSIDGPAVLDLT